MASNKIFLNMYTKNIAFKLTCILIRIQPRNIQKKSNFFYQFVFSRSFARFSFRSRSTIWTPGTGYLSVAIFSKGLLPLTYSNMATKVGWLTFAYKSLHKNK